MSKLGAGCLLLSLNILVSTATAVLVLLKLFGGISWDWLWVIAPLWIFGMIIILIVWGALGYSVYKALNEAE